jgi:ribosomal protein S8E
VSKPAKKDQIAEEKTIGGPVELRALVLSKGQLMAETLAKARAARIREARARTPQPTLEQIAIEVGCCVKTVWNVVNERTHAGAADAPRPG